MKGFFFFLLLLVSVSSFASKGRHFCEPIRTTIPCRLELALVCGDGYVDGCLTQQTSVHRCVLKSEGPSCRQDIQILCIQGFRDGCELGRTTRHQCVPVLGPECEDNFDCPEGFTDRCNG